MINLQTNNFEIEDLVFIIYINIFNLKYIYNVGQNMFNEYIRKCSSVIIFNLSI